MDEEELVGSREETNLGAEHVETETFQDEEGAQRPENQFGQTPLNCLGLPAFLPLASPGPPQTSRTAPGTKDTRMHPPPRAVVPFLIATFRNHLATSVS